MFNKPATEFTTEELANLVHAIYYKSHSGDLFPDPESFSSWATENKISFTLSHVFFTPEHPKNPIGAAFISEDEGSRSSQIVAFGVVRCFRGKGQADKALQILAQSERVRGMEVLEVVVAEEDVYAVKRFEAAGFTRIEGILESVSEQVRLRLQL